MCNHMEKYGAKSIHWCGTFAQGFTVSRRISRICQLSYVCRSHASASSESARWPEGLTVAGLLRPEPSQTDWDDSWGRVLTASLAVHGGLREELVQGLCLFRLAGYRSHDGGTPDEARGAQILALLQSKVAQTAAAVRFNMLHALYPCYNRI